jgi:hypothetical protein
MIDYKTWGIKNNKRVPIQQVVDAAPVIVEENDPDLLFLNPKKVIVVSSGKVVYDKYANVPSGYMVGSPGPGDPPSEAPGEGADDDADKDRRSFKEYVIDTPSISDIESIKYEQYYDTITKGAKYKAIIKIRNSSAKSSSVKGVDARIYNPAGAV